MQRFLRHIMALLEHCVDAEEAEEDAARAFDLVPHARWNLEQADSGIVLP